MDIPELSRRHFLRLGAGTVVVLGLGACASDGATSSSSGPIPPPRSTGPTATTTPASTTSVPGTTASTIPTAQPTGLTAAGRRLVIVQMNGGNDGLNTVVPLDGRYHDARPTLGLADDQLVALTGTSEVGLHPSLAPLTTLWEAGQLAVVQGVGFANPNRSHFVSLDRWWRADEVTAPGWLGRVLDGLRYEPAALYATSLGTGAPLLSGAVRQPASIAAPAGFRFDGVDAVAVRALSDPSSSQALMAAAQHAYARAVDSVTDFASVLAAAHGDGGADDEREGGATLAGGLALAAELLSADIGTEIVVVSASGFDTHSNQAPTQKALLADLAKGLTEFDAAMKAAGIDALVLSTSEFGRRVQENGSGGTDHGAGNVSFLVGQGVEGGLYGATDLADQLDGDVRPVIDPRTLYTACLDWIGADPTAVLGRRYDEVRLLAS